MVDVELIKQMKRKGRSVREISRMTGWSRQSVRKHLVGPAEPPVYKTASPRPSPVMGPYLGVVTRWLEDDEKAPRKQRHTARRIYDRLVDEYGFCGAEVTVRKAVAKIRGKRIEAYVPLEAPWGGIAQVDFGGAVVTIGCERTKVALFCMRAKASKVPFVIAMPSERLECFLQGHVDAFEFFGGVFSELWYDNPKTAVTKILSGPDRIEHERLSALRAHYLFDSRFCTPACGNEKGSVENLVGYVRRNALVPHTRSFASIEAVNEHLHAWCERERTRHGSAWEIETKALAEMPAHQFRASTSRPVVANKTSMVSVDRVRYSVPVTHTGRTLRAELFIDRVEVFDGATPVASHERSHTKGDTVLDLAHYLDAFERKPRAALSCAALGSADPVFTSARDMALRTPDGHRTFAKVLLLAREFGLAALADALRTAIGSGAVTPERVRQLALNAAHHVPDPIDVPDALAVPLTVADITCYDELAVCAP
ncbi:MAG: IS21 family transposase [Planctomycetota bacterium]|nr:IS21 family transposase [Planctomycetota bacterium]